MDQFKIGKFIAERRKVKGLTQIQLAEKLNITDRAVSKWETGRAMPDSSIMLELCKVLNISVNDLLSGEKVDMDNYNKEMEKKLLEMVKEKEQADKRLITIEIITGVVCIFVLLATCCFAAYVQLEDWLRIVLVVVGCIPVLIAAPFMLKIEQTAGYYKCGNCAHTYVPKYKSVFFAPHIGTTRYMKCPKCGAKTWQKKVLKKED